MLGTILSFSVMAVAGRELAGALDTFEIMLYRSAIGMVIVLGSDLSRQPLQAMVKRVPMATPVVVVGEEDPPGTSILSVLAWP